jgi:hypothetical protein
MAPDQLGHFARVHQRSVALVRYVLRNDPAAAAVLLSEIHGPDAAAAQIVSLAQLCGLLLAQTPAEEHESLLNKAAMALAAAVES